MENFDITVVEKRLKFLRDLKGLTQKELGTILGVSQSLINSWENGYQNISLSQLVKLSYFYQVPIDYIFGLITKFNNKDYTFKSELDLISLGKNLKLIRKMENLTQSEFASKIKTNFTNISNYEKGKATISSADFKDICNTFGYSADWCIGSTLECIKRPKKIALKEEEIRKFIKI